MQLGIFLFEYKAHGALVQHLDPVNIAIIDAVLRMRLLAHQDIKREFDIFRQHRLTVAETRFRVEVERCGEAVLGQRKIIRQQTIHTERLIQAFFQQRFEHQFTETGGGDALEQKRIEAVKGAKCRQRQCPAFFRIRIDVIEMFEVFGIFRRVAHRH